MFLNEWLTRSHLRVLDYVPARGNARYFQCLIDEDMIRRVPGQNNISNFWGLTLGPQMYQEKTKRRSKKHSAPETFE